MTVGMGRLLVVVLACLSAGCSTYRARPIDPVRTQTEFRARTFQDRDLLAFVRRYRSAQAPKGPDRAWDLEDLTLAALYRQGDLAIARAQLATAVAGIRTAAAHPNPTLSLGGGIEDLSPPLLLDVGLDLLIETAGRRQRRIDQAQALSEAARYHLEGVCWQVRSQVRAALVDDVMAIHEASLLRVENRADDAVVAVLTARRDAGAVSEPEVEAARISGAQVRLALRAAEGRLAVTRAALAQAVGMPVKAFDSISLDSLAVERLIAPSALPLSSVQRAGLLNRADVRQALADYQASEAALRLEIAKQYPDIHLAPGYALDGGADKYTIGLSLSLPIFNQHQGPIAEAEARRQEVAARFLAIQQAAIGSEVQALAHYQGAMGVLDMAGQTLAVAQRRRREVAAAFAAGVADRLTLVEARIGEAAADVDRLRSLRDAQIALGALEDAVQGPLGHSEGPSMMSLSLTRPEDPPGSEHQP